MKLLSFLLALLSVPALAQRPATLVLKNANVYTVDDKHPHAEAVAGAGERGAFVRNNAEVQKDAGPQTEAPDPKGAPLGPGFTHAAHHFFGVGQGEPSF